MSVERILWLVVAIAALVLGILLIATDVDVGWSERVTNGGQNIVIGMLSLALAFRRG